jgi:hypothetical protein
MGSTTIENAPKEGVIVATEEFVTNFIETKVNAKPLVREEEKIDEGGV